MLLHRSSEKANQVSAINYLMVFAVMSLLLASHGAVAQDCTAQFQVNAGPGIDVCTGGQVNMFGKIGGDATVAAWRGGKGTFDPDRNALVVHYTPAPEEAGTTVILLLVASNPAFPNCQPQRSEIKIVVNEEVKADAGADIAVCSGEPVMLSGKVKGKAKETIWLTNGNGRFDNPYIAEAIYYPGDQDNKIGVLSLEFVAVAYGMCDNDTDRMVLSIDPAFAATVPEKLKSKGYEDVPLKLTMKGNASRITWTTNGKGKFSDAAAAETVYSPNGADVKAGTVTLHVAAVSAGGKCRIEKDIELKIEPRNASIPVGN